MKRRIGAITYQKHTRLGAAIRPRLSEAGKTTSATRLLIVLSDGRPYDHDYGDARTPAKDTRGALRTGKDSGHHAFLQYHDRNRRQNFATSRRDWLHDHR